MRPAFVLCEGCLRRSALIADLAPNVQRAREQGRRLPLLLGLSDEDLLQAVGGKERAKIAEDVAGLDGDRERRSIWSAGLSAFCRCDERYPPLLAPGPDAPAVLYVAGGLDRFRALAAEPCVAVVGARRASAYGLEVARGLGRGLSAAGVTVVSGLALGIDSAAHEGALQAGGRTIAVLAGGANKAYPPRKEPLYRRIREEGAVISELPLFTEVWRWAFPARNRIIAGLAPLTVVVEAGERSGSLITAGIAEDLGRDVGAVPGRVTSPLAAGPNALLQAGAHLVRDASDVLDLLFGAGVRPPAPDPAAAVPERLRPIWGRVGDGEDSAERLVAGGVPLAEALAALAELEQLRLLCRGPGGRFVLSAG